MRSAADTKTARRTPPIERTAPEARHATWADVHREIEALVCLRTLELDDGETIEEPMFGPRACEAPPADTALGRAVVRAYEDANPILSAMRHAYEANVIAAMKVPASERLEAVRRAFLGDRFVGLLLAHLEPALADEGLACPDCPAPFEPKSRTVAWDTFEPYLAAYIWPDPVATPRDERGKPTGEPEYTMHICVGINGIDELPERDGALIELGFLATLHNEAVLERAPELYREIRTDPAFARVREDDARTQWLRAQLGPRLFAEPAIRRSVCEAVEKFRSDTGIGIHECDADNVVGTGRP